MHMLAVLLFRKSTGRLISFKDALWKRGERTIEVVVAASFRSPAFHAPGALRRDRSRARRASPLTRGCEKLGNPIVGKCCSPTGYSKRFRLLDPLIRGVKPLGVLAAVFQRV